MYLPYHRLSRTDRVRAYALAHPTMTTEECEWSVRMGELNDTDGNRGAQKTPAVVVPPDPPFGEPADDSGRV